jgi:protein-S-isoprenylcysteine O-methyltransferase Ste14
MQIWFASAEARTAFFALRLLFRMRVEEEALLRGLGPEYPAYMKHTKRLIPGVY